MYFGTTTEILENDGQNWRRIYLPYKSNVRSLLKAGSVTIYVGGSGEIGYLKTDSHGQIVYQSLVLLIDSADAEFPDTWEIFETQVDSTSNNIIANKSIAYITVDSNQNLYTCGFDGVYMIKNIKDERFKKTFSAIIRKVTINDDTTVFWGTWSDSSGLFSNIQPKDSILKIRYNQRNITFSYSCHVFYGDANVLFSYKLEGYDKNWSAWSNETTNKYTNLHEGTYNFQVKAKNIYGIESQTAGYKFIILAPWYRTYWAYAGYILILILLIYFIVKINSRRLKKQNLHLSKWLKNELFKFMHKMKN